MTVPPPIFDSALLRTHLARARRQGPADFLLVRTVEDIGERLNTLPRAFSAIADLGTPTPALQSLLVARWPQAEDLRLSPLAEDGHQLTGDLEHLPIAPESLDLAVSALALQTVNDLPGALV